MRTPAECEAELRSIRDAMHRLSRFDSLSNVQQRDWDRLSATFESVDAERMDAVNDGVRSRMRAGLRDGSIHSERGAPVDTGDPHASGRHRSNGLRAVDAAGHVEDEVRHIAANLIDRAAPGEQDRVSRYVSATISHAYERAVAKLFNDPMTGSREFDDEELRAFQLAQSEKRAMNLGDGPSGAFLVPFTLDPAIWLVNAGAVNPIRQLAKCVTTITNSWNGISSAGVSASFTPEASEVVDASPVLARPSIPVHRATAWVQASYEVSMDSSLAAQVGGLFTDARTILEANKYTLGSGVGEPKGLITALVAAGGSSVVTSAGTALTVADVVASMAALPPRWRARAAWMMNLSIINQGRQIPVGAGLLEPLIDDDGDGMMMAPGDPGALGGGMGGMGGGGMQAMAHLPSMFGFNVFENSYMDGTITAGATPDYAMLLGDFANYVIVDRLGLTTAYVPVLFGSSGRRPSGEQGWLAYWRTGADLVNPDGFRLTNYSG